MLSSRDEELVQRFKSHLDRRGIGYHRIIVFGSRARGDATPDSDLDVLVVLEEETPVVRDAIEDCAWEVGFEQDVYIHPIIKRRSDIDEGPESESRFMMAVLAEGVKF
jgi:predicted nucleotidyltransferase